MVQVVGFVQKMLVSCFLKSNKLASLLVELMLQNSLSSDGSTSIKCQNIHCGSNDVDLKGFVVLLKFGKYRLRNGDRPWQLNIVFEPISTELRCIMWLFTKTFIEPYPLKSREHWGISDPCDPRLTIWHCKSLQRSRLGQPIHDFIPRMVVVSFDVSPCHLRCRGSALNDVNK